MIKKFIEEVNLNKKKWHVVPEGYIGYSYYCGEEYIHFIKKVSRFLRNNYPNDSDALRFIELASKCPTSCYDDEFNEMIECLKVIGEDEENVISEKQDLKLIGEGAYAKVFSYRESVSNIKLAIKRIKKDVNEKELMRFKKEYEYMKDIHHPNVLEVYKYNDEENSYIMEFCDSTLYDFISKNNNKEFMTFEYRKSLVNQLIMGIKCIHSKDLLHRDISFNNILVKSYDENIAILKISDFGITKNLKMNLTSFDSEKRGTIIDPVLEDFKKYNLKNEIYSLGIVINFIFTSKITFKDNHDELSKIINKCTIRDYDKRYNNLDELLNDINSLNDLNSIKNDKVIDINYKNHEKSGLNKYEIDILYNASIGDGYIFIENGLDGTYIYAGGKVYDASKPREEAFYKKYINDLLFDGYISCESDNEYKLTYKAYELFE